MGERPFGRCLRTASAPVESTRSQLGQIIKKNGKVDLFSVDGQHRPAAEGQVEDLSPEESRFGKPGGLCHDTAQRLFRCADGSVDIAAAVGC